MSNSALNRRWAEVILEALSRHGLRHVCIAPGSRSTPLTLAAAANDKFVCHTHFDERGLGHLALGLAKSTRMPVAVIVTSGTAVANLYPALIEAGLTGERVIFLTADRPPELIDCGANQAIRQSTIFSSHPSATLALPRPTFEITPAWLVSSLDDIMNRLQHGAVHINCPFAEPLYDDDGITGKEWQSQLGNWWQSDKPWLQQTRCTPVISVDDWFFWRQKKGVIIAGRMQAGEGKQLRQWADSLGWPLISDVLSQTGQSLPHADLWLASARYREVLAQADVIIQFGSSLTGKRLLQWQAACTPPEFWIIDTIPGRLDPANHRGRKFDCSVGEWLDDHPAQSRTPWALQLTGWTQALSAHVTETLSEGWGEAQIARRLNELLPLQGILFAGNSLIVRLIDAFAQLPCGYPVYSNRGASGIDGLISTAAGVQRGSAKPTLAVIGDISALYDLNSLALLRHTNGPFVLLIVNNNGGQIFSMLPTPEQERQKFYCMPQSVSFAAAAQMFGLNYSAPADWTSLTEALKKAWSQHCATVIEVVTDGDTGARCLQQLVIETAQ
ncbi:2-succinyl-5-enolpyruvyl-6-hydroxy-3-cyclohexene-1-carboxylic-acid synthase [Morganella psychrotolerans]|uniref:2-succinyl-5-enolpyruvyl-6-hydroxy-3- cyclohexene-1-carboxylic-acid synthase n=1 Tax=Morganella psychrotolerans TaxID=368603 RepID=UPI0039B0C918